MGMYDSLIDSYGSEWQTKAFHNSTLRKWVIGEKPDGGAPFTYQVEIMGRDEAIKENFISYATLVDGVIAEVNVPRNKKLPLLCYYGDWEVLI